MPAKQSSPWPKSSHPSARDKRGMGSTEFLEGGVLMWPLPEQPRVRRVAVMEPDSCAGMCQEQRQAKKTRLSEARDHSCLQTEQLLRL